MWTYEQASGQLARDGEKSALGYSGRGVGKNNPLYERVPNVGPIPRGVWIIGKAFNTPDHGPIVMTLMFNRNVGHAETSPFGRSGFLMHGDSAERPGLVSKGCIVLPRPTREVIASAVVAGDNLLYVV